MFTTYLEAITNRELHLASLQQLSYLKNNAIVNNDFIGCDADSSACAHSYLYVLISLLTGSVCAQLIPQVYLHTDRTDRTIYSWRYNLVQSLYSNKWIARWYNSQLVCRLG